MIKIYHNPRCRKSREGLEILKKSGKDFEVIKYLEDVPSRAELQSILSYLDVSPENLVRKTEAIWIENYRGKLLLDDDIIDAMLLHPKLIERPIVVNGSKAIVGRPPESIGKII